MSALPENRLRWLLAAALALLTLLLYLPVRHHHFITYDDPEYVTENPRINGGVTWAGIKWAFTGPHSASWHPLTSISEMLDCQLFGLNAGAHLMVNVLLHALSAALLFLLLQRATGSTWRSLAVACFFAWHPLRVESVAWVSERKDVLCGLFWMLTLLAYLKWVEKPDRRRYAILVASFGLGILTKATIVTLPVVLLLLDFWPLRRLPFPSFAGRGQGPGNLGDARAVHVSELSGSRPWFAAIGRLTQEKLPLFALSVLLSLATVLAQQTGGAMVDATKLSLATKVSHAMVAYVEYLGMLVWPVNLAVFYPHPGAPPWWQLAGAAALLLTATVLAIRVVRFAPYVLAGWLWYLITLLPMIGIVQVGAQSIADRYTYVPTIGLMLAVVWGLAEWAAVRPAVQTPLRIVAVLALVACAVGTIRQLSYWRNTETLFTRALQVTSRNLVAHGNLANYYAAVGKGELAASHYRALLEINPDQAETHNNLGALLANQGKLNNAMLHYREALRLKPDHAEAHNNLGIALLRQGKLVESVEHFEAAVRAQPGLISAHFNLGLVLASLGKLPEAAGHLGKVLELDPNDASACLQLGLVLWRQRQYANARRQIEAALARKPDWALALERLAWLLATAPDEQVRDGQRAVDLAQRARKLAGPGQPQVWNALAAAHAESGNFPEAVKAAQQAIEVARGGKQNELLGEYQQRLRLYQAGRPCREIP